LVIALGKANRRYDLERLAGNDGFGGDCQGPGRFGGAEILTRQMGNRENQEKKG